MKMPSEINVYCPSCKVHGPHKVKLAKKGRTRALSEGQRKHEAKGKGYTSKIAGKIKVVKQSKRQVVMLECQACKKKHPKTIGSRTKKLLEITTH